jgi:acetyl esterase/lipase
MSLWKYAFNMEDALKAPFANRFKGEGVAEELDIPYSSNLEDKHLRADLFIPVGPPSPNGDTPLNLGGNNKKFPVIVNIHGGGWVAGDKKWRHSVGNLFADAGIFVFAPNYRLSPKHRFPEPLFDVFTSINRLADNSEKYNLDLDNFYITGDSAGGHLAASVAAFQNNAQVQTELGLPALKVKFKGVMPLCGIYDFERLAQSAGSGGIIKDFTGCKRKKLSEFKFLKQLSPVNYITPEFPPAFILSASQDIFTKPQPAILKAKLKECGVPYAEFEGHGFSGSDHCFHLRWRQKQSRYVFAKIIDIVQSNL